MNATKGLVVPAAGGKYARHDEHGRERLETAEIVQRLHRGEDLHEQ